MESGDLFASPARPMVFFWIAAAAWKKDGGAESHAQVVKLMYTALDTLEDDVEEVCCTALTCTSSSDIHIPQSCAGVSIALVIAGISIKECASMQSWSWY